MPNPAGRPAFGINQPYVDAVTHAGGLPICLPMDLSNDDLDRLLPRLDGILFTGGYDLDPRLYGSQPHPRVEGVDANRDRVEIYLARAMAQSGKPFFGICRGCQVVNVALGGSLYEHLPEQLPGDVSHDRHDMPRNYLAHAVNIEPDNQLNKILTNSQAQVNSLHHQGVRRLAEGLRITAHSLDGLVEAFELTGHPFGLAVQWHPEELQALEEMRKLFRAFIQACRAANSEMIKSEHR